MLAFAGAETQAFVISGLSAAHRGRCVPSGKAAVAQAGIAAAGIKAAAVNSLQLVHIIHIVNFYWTQCRTYDASIVTGMAR